MKFLRIICSILISTSFLLCGCTGSITGYSNKTAEENNISYRISDTGKKAFAETYTGTIDPSLHEIIIPDTVSGAKVTSIGGFTGTGVPAVFMFEPKEDRYHFYTDNPDPSQYGCDITWQDIPVTITLGRNLERVARFASPGYYGTRQEDGTIAFYHPVLSFSLPEGSDYLAADNGILKPINEKTPVDINENAYQSSPPGPVYEDLDFYERIRGSYRIDYDEHEYAVAEVFAAFGKLYMNIGTYYDDELYVYAAAEITPVETLDDHRILAEIRQFSGFSMAGQYWSEEPAGYEISVQEDALVFAGWDGHGEPLVPDSDYLRLERAKNLPSQFPVDPACLDTITDGADAAFPQSYLLIAQTVETDDILMEILRDGTITVLIKNAETPMILRGICAGEEFLKLRFCMSMLGYGTRPYYGKVSLRERGQYTTVENYDAYPLIPEGQDTAAFRKAE